MKSWKTAAVAAVALIWCSSAMAAQPIRAVQSGGAKATPASALSLAPRAGAKMRGANKLDAGEFGPLSIAVAAAAVVGAYFFYTEVIDDDDDDEPASP
jgi:hypothetical protein